MFKKTISTILIWSLSSQAVATDCLYRKFQGTSEQVTQFQTELRQAITRFGVSEAIMLAIKVTESSLTLDSGVKNHNSNGTTDTSLFQVNREVWGKELRKIGVTLPEDAFYDLRTNINLAAWIISRLSERHSDLYEVVGRYHSGTPHLKKRYQAKVAKNARWLLRQCQDKTS